jgi:outer membrane lipoprotein-sorting protein
MKRLFVPVILALALFCFGQSASNAAGETPKAQSNAGVDEVIKKITSSLQSVKTLKAEFAQERHLAIFLDVLSSHGVLYFELPGKLRWEITEPFSSILIFNGGAVAKFNRENGAYVRMKLGMEDVLREVLSQIIAIMRGDLEKIGKVYGISVIQGAERRLVLKPLSAGLAKVIKDMELSVDRETNHISKIVIHEPHDDYIEIRFLREEQDGALNPSLFDLTNPLLPAVSGK